MKQFLVRFSTTGLMLALLAGSMTTPVSADDVSFRDSITLSPTSVRFQAGPGETLTNKLTVINDGETDYDFIVYARPYSVKDQSYTPEFTKQLVNTDAYAWVQFNQVKYHLNPGASIEVPFSVTIPAKASPGGHYGVIFAETQPKLTGTDSIARKKRVGTILYATIKGEYNMKGSVTSTDISPLQFRSPLSAALTAKNEGNADFLVSATLKISDVFGQVKYDVTSDYPVLPDTTRKIQLEWKNSPWFGIYKVDVSTVMLNQQKTSVSAYVLIVPRWLLIFIGLLIVGGIGYELLRRRKK